MTLPKKNSFPNAFIELLRILYNNEVITQRQLMAIIEIFNGEKERGKE